MTNHKLKLIAIALLFACIAIPAGCGGPQQGPAVLDTRPLEETKALEIIESMLTKRGYIASKGEKVELATKSVFPCDYRINGHKIAIEYLTAQDRTTIGNIPPAAQGSRLHVLPAKVPALEAGAQGEPVYIYFVDEQKYIYQYNPTSENRADVTYLEVESRLRRDLADFLSWYESSSINEK